MSDMDSFFEDARNADSLIVAQELCGAKLKTAAAAEYEGPCPSCGGTDRFSVNTRKKIFNCRHCRAKGSNVDLVMLATGCSPIEAAERINGRPRPNGARDESEEERAARLAATAKRQADAQRRAEEQRRIEEAKEKRDEEAIAYVREHGVAIPDSPQGKAYFEARGLTPHPRLIKDILFVPALDYWGARANGDGAIVRLATLPAVVALIRDTSNEVIGCSAVYLDPIEPRKWKPEGSPANSARKIRGAKKHGLIRLGRPNETLAVREGWESCLAWQQLHPDLDVALAAAVDLGNLSGGATGTIEHPVLKDADGKPRRVQNSIPDPDKPGLILPEGVRRIVLIADNDSEPGALAAHLLTAVTRFLGLGLEVVIDWPAAGLDWNDVLLGGQRRKPEFAAEVEALRHPGGTEGSAEFIERARLILKPADILAAAAALQKGDEAALTALMRKAAETDLTGVQADMLIKAIARSTGVGLKPLRQELARAQAEARKRAWEAGAEERQRLEAEREAMRQRLEEEEHDRIWRSCSTIALSKTLLRDMETVVHALGVVGESAGVRALYLTYVSRLLVDEAVRLLRLGAPASGKKSPGRKSAGAYSEGIRCPDQRVESKGARLFRRRRRRRAQAQDRLRPRSPDHGGETRRRKRIRHHAAHPDQRGPRRLPDCRPPGWRPSGHGDYSQERPDRRRHHHRARRRPRTEDPRHGDGHRRNRRPDRRHRQEHPGPAPGEA
jgi:hypothetical protein